MCPALLAFGAISRAAGMTTAPSQMQRVSLIDDVMKRVEKELARRRISLSLKQKHGPKGKLLSPELPSLPARSPVLVYRSSSESWVDPFKFINIDGENAAVRMPCGRKLFRSSCLRPLNSFTLQDSSNPGKTDFLRNIIPAPEPEAVYEISTSLIRQQKNEK